MQLSGLALQVDDKFEDSIDFGGTGTGTFRDGELSVSMQGLRIQGEHLPMEINQDDLILGKRIGQGACSSVYKSRHKGTGQHYAIKLFSVYDKERRSQLRKEISTLSGVMCDSLIAFYGAYQDSGKVGVILEYMDRGSLEFMLDPHMEVSDYAMACISFQIMWGLAYLHHDNMLHRDIKPGNVLVNSYGQVKLSDFGIARALDNSQAFSSTSIGTFRYMSIERLLGDEYNTSSDVWSVAVTLIEVWDKKYPFEDTSISPIDLLQRLEDLAYSGFDEVIPRSCSRNMASFLSAALSADPKQKRKAEVYLEAAWFTENFLDIDSAREGVATWLRDLESDRPGKKKYRKQSTYDEKHADDSDQYDSDFEEDEEEKGGDSFRYRK
mmetsp:Transcript_14835/g.22326  ORF Transcript_14835/g.22326 Transcript_14835/m.22326 type:complete len:381 (+) Transcript_14835:82-1224(+)